MEHIEGKMEITGYAKGWDIIVKLDGVLLFKVALNNEAHAKRLVKCWESHDELLAASKVALELITGERIAYDFFPPKDEMGKALEEAMRQTERQLEQAIAEADKR